VIKAYENRLYTNNQITITPELIALFREYWDQLVITPHTPNFSLPFYHLSNESSRFWQLKLRRGASLALTSSRSIRSFNSLNEAVDYAAIEFELSELLKDPPNRDILRFVILETYFKDTYQRLSERSGYSILEQFGNDILEEDPEKYVARIKKITEESKKEEVEEELYLRGAAFKREIPRIYDYTCAVSGYRVHSFENISLIDACHIIPFSESHNDSVTNGIALSPTIHRAFDRGLIGFDDDYRVLVSEKFVENESIFSIRQFHGRDIHLPPFKKYHPALENLRNHRLRWGL
jgi:putative restriction endonuclease